VPPLARSDRSCVSLALSVVIWMTQLTALAPQGCAQAGAQTSCASIQEFLARDDIDCGRCIAQGLAPFGDRSDFKIHQVLDAQGLE
jgi:hypothetical protein